MNLLIGKPITAMIFYKYSYTSFWNLIPKIEYSKNVQGWFFTRSLTIYWIRHAITFRKTINSNFNIDRILAHSLNVEKYMSN